MEYESTIEYVSVGSPAGNDDCPVCCAERLTIQIYSVTPYRERLQGGEYEQSALLPRLTKLSTIMINNLLHSLAFMLAAVCTSFTCMCIGIYISLCTGNVNLGMSIFLFGTISILLLMGFLD